MLDEIMSAREMRGDESEVATGRRKGILEMPQKSNTEV